MADSGSLIVFLGQTPTVWLDLASAASQQIAKPTRSLAARINASRGGTRR